MEQLSLQYLKLNAGGDTRFPASEQLSHLPERVLQFGTGVLLRGLPDYLIDKANRQGIFNGRIVVVKSTDGGGELAAFNRQNNLYTVCIRGLDEGETVEQNVICSAISRVLSAKEQWQEILEVATSPDLQIVISNTTEIGIQLQQDDIRQSPPKSYPGKLLAVLYARFKAFGGDRDKGLVIVPTELIPDNGTKLEAILLELAHRNALEAEFIDWLESANYCCNSLVDRIVPGRPDMATRHALVEQLGYDDELLTISEVYRLWAIEGDEHVQHILSFSQADEGVIIRPDISLYRELKLRLLNGTHTFSCGLGVLCGFETVREALDNELMASYVQNLMLGEMVPGIPMALDEKMAQRFGMQVIDRFRNPYIEHRWLSITMQYSAKMQMRNVPTLLHFYRQVGGVPGYMALGFAAYILFMRAIRENESGWWGIANGVPYLIQDEKASYFADLWSSYAPKQLVTIVLASKSLWGFDLTQLPGFANSVHGYLSDMLNGGVYETVAQFLNKKETVS